MCVTHTPCVCACARVQGMMLHALVALSIGPWALMVYSALVVMQLRPPWDAQYVIPVLGMLLVRGDKIMDYRL